MGERERRNWREREREEREGGVSRRATTAREDADAGGARLAPATQEMGFFFFFSPAL